MRLPSNRAPAFTLIELLVAIGIAVVLIGIVFTVSGGARQRAQQVKCASNLRQLGLALQAYCQSYRELPPQADPIPFANAMTGIQPAIAPALRCPAAPPEEKYSYRMNAQFAGEPRSAGAPGDVLATEVAPRHNGKSNTLFFDGHVE